MKPSKSMLVDYNIEYCKYCSLPFDISDGLMGCWPLNQTDTGRTLDIVCDQCLWAGSAVQCFRCEDVFDFHNDLLDKTLFDMNTPFTCAPCLESEANGMPTAYETEDDYYGGVGLKTNLLPKSDDVEPNDKGGVIEGFVINSERVLSAVDRTLEKLFPPKQPPTQYLF